MPAARYRLIVAIVSAIIAAGLWVLCLSLMPAAGKLIYAVLVCSESVPDREICQSLEDQGFSGLVSESGQWVLLDSFSGIEQIPLDEYHGRILSFDPRNDGYAEKLRSLFVQDGKRFVYIRLGSDAPSQIEKKIISALGDTPHSLVYARRDNAGTGFSPLLLFALFCGSAGVLLAIRPLRSALRQAGLASCLPALSPLALGGAIGFALISLLTGFAILASRLILPRPRFMFQPVPRPKTESWFFLPIILGCCGMLVFFSGISLVFFLLVFALFCGVFIFSVRDAYRNSRDLANSDSGSLFFSYKSRQRFNPVPILSIRPSRAGFFWTMLPCAAIALALAFTGTASISVPADFDSIPSPDAVTEADYYAHYVFQSTFSQRSLYNASSLYEIRSLFDAAPSDEKNPGEKESFGMSDYQFASDGLPVQGDIVVIEPLLSNAPPFPLADFLQHLKAIRD